MPPCPGDRVNRRRAPGRLAAMPRKEPPAPKRVLSIHAHPDDQEFTVAGTLAKWARAGSEIVTVCLTRGEAGSNKGTPADMTRERLAKIREEEPRASRAPQPDGRLGPGADGPRLGARAGRAPAPARRRVVSEDGAGGLSRRE